MFCKNCGNPTEGEATLCPQCAAAQPAPVEEQPGFTVSNGEVRPPKKGKGKLIALIAGAVALVLVLAAVFCWDSLAGMFQRSFGSPEEYFVYVHEQAADEVIAQLRENYSKNSGTALSATEGAYAHELHLLLGGELISILNSSGDMDLSWLSDIALTVDTDTQDKLSSVKMGIGLGDKTALSVDALVDMENLSVYLGLPGLAEGYVQCTAEDMKEAGVTMPDPAQQKQILEQILPDEKALFAVLERYTDLLLSKVKTVTKEEKTVTVGGISQKMVVLEAKITEADLTDMALAVLEQAKTDAELEKLLDQFSAYENSVMESTRQQMSEYYTEEELNEYFPEVDYHAEMLEAIPDAIADIQESKAEASEQNYFLLTGYVTPEHELAGHTFAVYTEGVKEEIDFSYITVKDGKNSAFEAKIQQVQITGSGAEVKDAFSGSYTVSDVEHTYGTLTLENVTENSGVLSFTASSELLESMGAEEAVSSLLSLTQPTLKLTYSGSEKDLAMKLELLAGDKLFAGITWDAKVVEAGNLQLPADAVRLQDQQALLEWVNTIQSEKLMENLTDAGVPEQFLQDLLQSLIMG